MKNTFKIKISLFSFLIFIATPTCFAQEENSDIKKGNKFYEEEKYVESEIEYRKG